MAAMVEQPLLLVDVDGVLNPLGRVSGDFRSHDCVVDGVLYKVRLNPLHGAALLAVAKETGAALTWATTWEDDANTWIGPEIGLSPLPVVPMPPPAGRTAGGEYGEMFKTPHVARYAEGRPFVWFDDDVWTQDEDYLRDHPDVDDFLLIRVDARRGLGNADIARAHVWLTETAR
jgi:HAD domain in Swiss Army Knife RNA repair proteins